jgi:hypothetical protein
MAYSNTASFSVACSLLATDSGPSAAMRETMSSGQLAYHFGVQDAWQLWEQAPLDGQGADRVDDRLQRNLLRHGLVMVGGGWPVDGGGVSSIWC